MDEDRALIRRYSRRVTPADVGRRFDDWAGEWLSRSLERPVSRSEIRRWIMVGAVRLQGTQPRRPETPLRAGQRAEASLRAEAAAGQRAAPLPGLDASRILFEDAWLVAVDKPAGIPTHETADPRRPHLVAWLTRLLAERGGEGGESKAVRLGVHQRLDLDTSGVILFTRDRSADADLARQFAERAVSKTYHALTVRPARPRPERWTATGWKGPEPGGPAAQTRTEFRRIEAFAKAWLVEARPLSGRKHQIRVHLAQSGSPILGDDRYGPRSASRGTTAPRLMLHASCLELRHPITGAPLVIESPWPPDFERLVRALRAEGARGSGPARGRSSPR